MNPVIAVNAAKTPSGRPPEIPSHAADATAGGAIMIASVGASAHDLFTGIEAVFGQAIARGRESGEFGAALVADTAASQLLACVIGLSVLVKATGSSEKFDAVVDGIVSGLRSPSLI